MPQDRPHIGILLMLGFCVLAPLGDALAKILAQAVPIGALLLVRFGIQALVLIPLVRFSGRPWRMRGRVLWLAALRTVLHILGIGMMVAALKVLPLADAIAIAFVMPFILLLLGWWWLGEEVGPRRFFAALIGFLGTLLVIQPSFAEVGAAALLPLGVALNFALFMLVTRQIARETDPISLQAVSGAMAVAMLLPALLLGQFLPALPSAIVAPTGLQIGLLLAIGLIGTFAHLLMTWSLRFAQASTLAPMQYLEIPVAALFGWAIFSDWPDGLALLGILVTVAAGLYVAVSERPSAVSRRLAARQAPPPAAPPAI